MKVSTVSAAPIWFPKSFRFPLSSFHFTLMAVMVAAESGQSKRTTPFFAFATLFCPSSRSKNSQQPVTIQHQKAGYHTIPTRLPSKSRPPPTRLAIHSAAKLDFCHTSQSSNYSFSVATTFMLQISECHYNHHPHHYLQDFTRRPVL